MSHNKINICNYLPSSLRGALATKQSSWMATPRKMRLAITGLAVTIIYIIPFVVYSSQETTQLNSDSAIFKQQENENICTYIGNARFNKNLTSLQSQQIIIHQNKSDNKINKIIASGKDSHYITAPDTNKQSTTANADSITIYPNDNLIILEGNGQITINQNNGSSVLQSPKITIYQDKVNNKIGKIIASGKGSHYNSIPNTNDAKKNINNKNSSNEQSTTADADSITIYPNDNLIILEGSGQITINQNNGSSVLQSPKITIYQDKVNNKIDKIIASGKGSHYNNIPNITEQQTKNQKSVIADADSIIIYPNKSLMILDGNGQILSGQDKYSAPHIEYSI